MMMIMIYNIHHYKQISCEYSTIDSMFNWTVGPHLLYIYAESIPLLKSHSQVELQTFWTIKETFTFKTF